MEVVRLACQAMATRFELVLPGPDPRTLRAAGEEAIEEIHRIEAALSLYRPDSQIASVNRSAHREPVRVTPEVFNLIEQALVLSQATDGAFDITVGPLLHAWGLMRGTGQIPPQETLDAARACVGAHLVRLDPDGCRVSFEKAGMMLDLGSLGKGYALDRAAERLADAGIRNALLHGGTSTVIGRGTSADGEPWKVAIEAPRRAESVEPAAEPLAVVELRDESLSVSAVWGKGFEAEGHYYGHVMDPRAGTPVAGALLSAILLPSATDSDALSTALLVRGGPMIRWIAGHGPGWRCLVAERDASPAGFQVVAHGIEARHS